MQTSSPSPHHEPVMTSEVVRMLKAEVGGVFVDYTVGAGGHTRKLLEAGADRVIGFDRDADALKEAAINLHQWQDSVDLVHSDFRQFVQLLDDRGIQSIDGALADLGVSTMQLDGFGRGFSFRKDEPLDMRMDRSVGQTAAEMLRVVSESDLADVIYRFGEDRHARRIARLFVSTRDHTDVKTTGQLAEVVRRAVPRRGYQRIDPATRTFQAVRIWVNREVDALDKWLLAACRRLKAGARFAVLSFHSLEDRVVKHTFRHLERDSDVKIKILTKKPLRPSEQEVSQNPRARSAKLRVAERLS
jgi:16S rRNA (cytosine1402-N4)-methyltransferase